MYLKQISIYYFQINWRPVIGGFTLQFFFAAFILKSKVGYKIFEFLGKQVQTFLMFTDKGSQFVFGDKYTDHIFAMKVSYLQAHYYTSVVVGCFK